MPATEQAHAHPHPTPAASSALPFVTSERTTRQLAVTIVAPIKPSRLAPLRRLLEKMGEDAANNAVLPFGRLRTAHFARLVVLEKTTDLGGKPIPAQLLYMADIDEPLADHMDDLLAFGPGLDRVFEACEGYPLRKEWTREARLRWLEANMISTQAYYVNTVGRTVLQIQREALLHDLVDEFLDSGDWEGREPLEVRAAIQDYVNTRPQLAWARVPVHDSALVARVGDLAALALPIAGALAVAPLLAPLAPLYLLLLRIHELTDAVETQGPTAAHDRLLGELEDRGPQNQFTAIGFIKPGLLRRATIGIGVRGLNLAVRHWFNRGDLAGVKTIHFAHWTELDSGRRLVFASNYDGTARSYNDDFIDKLWWGLNLVFSNGVGWPRTALLIFGGARDEQAFKKYVRRHQIPTQVWYSAYPDLTALNIANNAKFRAGLVGPMNAEEAQQWLRLI